MNAKRKGTKTGGKKSRQRKSFHPLSVGVTWRDTLTATISTATIVLAAAVYLHGQLTDLRDAIHSNANDLAVVKSEISGLRRDVERLEKHASSADPNFDPEPVSLDAAPR